MQAMTCFLLLPHRICCFFLRLREIYHDNPPGDVNFRICILLTFASTTPSLLQFCPYPSLSISGFLCTSVCASHGCVCVFLSLNLRIYHRGFEEILHVSPFRLHFLLFCFQLVRCKPLRLGYTNTQFIRPFSLSHSTNACLNCEGVLI
jgi:hypothetical protein